MKFAHRSRGQALVESAISLALFLLLTMGVVDFARAAWNYNTISFLARDGARFGIVPGHDDVASYIANRCSPFHVDGCRVCVDGVVAGVCNIPYSPHPPIPRCGNPLTVTISYDFKPATPLISAFTGDTLTLTAVSKMNTELGPNCT